MAVATLASRSAVRSRRFPSVGGACLRALFVLAVPWVLLVAHASQAERRLVSADGMDLFVSHAEKCASPPRFHVRAEDPASLSDDSSDLLELLDGGATVLALECGAVARIAVVGSVEGRTRYRGVFRPASGSLLPARAGDDGAMPESSPVVDDAGQAPSSRRPPPAGRRRGETARVLADPPQGLRSFTIAEIDGAPVIASPFGWELPGPLQSRCIRKARGFPGCRLFARQFGGEVVRQLHELRKAAWIPGDLRFLPDATPPIPRYPDAPRFGFTPAGYGRFLPEARMEELFDRTKRGWQWPEDARRRAETLSFGRYELFPALLEWARRLPLEGWIGRSVQQRNIKDPGAIHEPGAARSVGSALELPSDLRGTIRESVGSANLLLLDRVEFNYEKLPPSDRRPSVLERRLYGREDMRQPLVSIHLDEERVRIEAAAGIEEAVVARNRELAASRVSAAGSGEADLVALAQGPVSPVPAGRPEVRMARTEIADEDVEAACANPELSRGRFRYRLLEYTHARVPVGGGSGRLRVFFDRREGAGRRSERISFTTSFAQLAPPGLAGDVLVLACRPDQAGCIRREHRESESTVSAFALRCARPAQAASLIEAQRLRHLVYRAFPLPAFGGVRYSTVQRAERFELLTPGGAATPVRVVGSGRRLLLEALDGGGREQHEWSAFSGYAIDGEILELRCGGRAAGSSCGDRRFRLRAVDADARFWLQSLLEAIFGPRRVLAEEPFDFDRYLRPSR